MSDFELIEHTIRKMKLVIKRFLNENGGYENGFETYVNTVVNYCVREKRADWSVPGMGSMTFKTYWDKGKEVYNSLRDCIDERLKDVDFVIGAESDEYGCYIMKIYAEFPSEEIITWLPGDEV